MTVGEAVNEGDRLLEGAGVDTARLDAELLIEKALGLTRLELYLDPDRELSPEELGAYRKLIERRARHEPTAYVLGEWGFRRLTLKVDPRVLIPRPETEVLVGRCLERLRDVPEPRVLDLGVGSGAIALAIADEHPDARVTGIDVSPEALSLARENAARTGIEIELLQVDMLSGLPGSQWDLVVSNPPYVRHEEAQGLAPEVVEWEPHVALFDGGHTEALVRAAAEALRPGGAIVLESYDERAGAVAELLARAGFAEVVVTRDLAGRDRVVEGRLPA